MIQTDEPDQCKEYIEQSLNKKNIHVNYCNAKLDDQASMWISTLPPLSQLDLSLKEFVHLKCGYLAKKMNHKLTRYGAETDEQKEFQEISRLLTSNDQVCR